MSLQARILRAPEQEIAAAATLVGAALAHPLLARARDAWRAGRCRRETPVACRQADGALVDGVLDLAFEDGDGWTVVDFKTDGDLEMGIERYKRQITLYAAAIETATGEAVARVLMQI